MKSFALSWTCEQLIALMETYSTRAHYLKLHGVDPLGLVSDALRESWGDPSKVKQLRMPLGFRIGRIHG